MDLNANTWMDAAFGEFLALRQLVQHIPNGDAGAGGGVQRQQPILFSSGSNLSYPSIYRPSEGLDNLRLVSVATSASAISSASNNPSGSGPDWAQHELQQKRAFPLQTLVKKRSLCDNVNSQCSGMGCLNKVEDTGRSSEGGGIGCSQIYREVMCPLCFASGAKAHLLDQCPLMLKR